MPVVKANLKDSIARLVLPLLLLATPACEKPEIAEESGSAPFPDTPLTPTFPIERAITDLQGRELKVSIVGKTGDDIFFTRQVDGKNFRLAISRLSPSDREFVRQLPSLAPPSGLKIEGETDQNASSEQPRYVSIRNERIKELEDEKNRLYEETDLTTNMIKVRTNRSEIERIDKEISELKADIQSYLRNNP